MNRRDAEARLVEKAQNDPVFRRALLANPTATIARDFNVQFPAGVQVRVVEETARELFVVLPVPTADTPLDDHQLDAVSGGKMMEEAKKLQDAAKEAAGSANTSSKVGW